MSYCYERVETNFERTLVQTAEKQNNRFRLLCNERQISEAFVIFGNM